MPTYQYRAINEESRTMRGQLTAANELDLEERLREVGMDLVTCREVAQRNAGFLAGRIKLKDMIVLCLHLEQLDRAGVPLLDALADVRESTDSDRLRDLLSDVYESVKSGEMLSQSFAKHPKVFDSVFVGLVAAGEKTGHLASSFYHLSHHMKWVSDLQRKVRKALSYPAFLAVVVIAVVSVLMMYVVPKLTDFMISQGFELPLHTRALIGFSSFLGNFWYIMLPIPFVVVIGIKIAHRLSPTFAYRFDKMLLKAPVIGNTLRKIDLARFTHFFSVMFQSGIDILESLEAAQKVVKNHVLQESVRTVRRSVSEGNSLTNSLRISNQFPNLVVRMFKVGEDSGNMDKALENINFFYDREVNDSVERMVGMVQPGMTIILGGMILWVVASVFGPLYETFSNLNF